MIDIYSYFTDRFYGVKDPRAIMPREREHMVAPSEPEEPSLETSGEESTAIEVVPETPLAESPTSNLLDALHTEPVEASSSPTESIAESGLPEENALVESSQSEDSEDKAEAEEEGEPFADILQENKDKKRYSPNPLPPQASEES
jgi:hypothetical protein